MITGMTAGGLPKSGLHATGKVRGGNFYTGGLIGHAGGDALSEVSFSGEVISDQGIQVGGIAGQAGNISQAVVSGYIQGINMVGGIAGTCPSIADVRVTAAVRGTMDSFGVRHGGIVASGSSVVRAAFLGSFKSFCTASCSSGGAGTISGSALGTHSLTYSLQPFTAVEQGQSAVLTGTSAKAKDADLWSSLCAAPGVWNCGDANSNYVQNAGEGEDLPRLSFENHACSNSFSQSAVSTQGTLGRGTSATNPVQICFAEQLAQIDATAATRGYHYVLEQDISLVNHSGAIVSTSAFTGHLQGKGHRLHGYKNLSASSNFGLFSEVGSSASIRNLKFQNISISTSGFNISLIANNAGTIDKIEAKSITLIAPSGVGGIVRSNTGVIQNSIFDGHISADSMAGGITAHNEGTIENVVVYGRLNSFNGDDGAGSYVSFGGISGTNNKNEDSAATISQAQFEGNLESFSSAWNIREVGGLVGSNVGGTVLDSVVTANATMFFTADTTEVGGLIGRLDTTAAGTVDRLIYKGILKHVNIDNAATAYIGANFGRIMGASINPLSVATFFPAISPTTATIATYAGPGFSYSAGFCTASSFSMSGLDEFTDYIAISPNYSFNPVLINYQIGDILTFEGSSVQACSKLNQNLEIYVKTPFSNNPISLTDLKTVHLYNIVNYDNGTDAEKRPLYDAHLAHIRGQALPANRPVWVYERGEYELFRVDK